jgi:1-phosphofructokinase family hexose kinase
VILAAGLTPAWQQILCFQKLALGEVNRAAEAHWCASGKVINAGMALATLGIASHTMAPLGGWSGAALRDEFARRNFMATWIETAAPTRVCTTVLDEGTHVTTELVENAAPLTETELNDYVMQYANVVRQAKMAVLTGSLPQRTPAIFYQMLLERTPCPVVLDARGPELLAALPLKPRVVKPNREELAMTVGRSLPDRGSLLSAMRELIERGAQSVVVTSGKDSVLVMEADQVSELTPPAITPIVNPIGCGDCLAAGIAIGLERGDTLVNAVCFGLAAAADNITQLLPARLSPERVARIMKEIV